MRKFAHLPGCPAEIWQRKRCRGGSRSPAGVVGGSGEGKRRANLLGAKQATSPSLRVRSQTTRKERKGEGVEGTSSAESYEQQDWLRARQLQAQPSEPFSNAETQRRSPFTDQRADKRALQADPTRRGGTDHGSLRTSPTIQGAVVPAPGRGSAPLIALMPHGLMRPHACCAADATAWRHAAHRNWQARLHSRH